MDIVNFKIKGKDVQKGIIDWEKMVTTLESDHKEKLSPKLRRAFLMNVFPKWLTDKVMERLDRFNTYKEMRDKAISLSQMHDGTAPVSQVETPPPQQWPQEYDEESGCHWQLG